MQTDTSPLKRWLMRLFAIAVWLTIWELTSRILNQEILLVSPFKVGLILADMLIQPDFYISIANSFGRIATGFLLSLAIGTSLAGLAHISELVSALLAPLMTCVKATPVASFVILALIWMRARYLAIFTAFLMGLPIFYEQVRLGLASVDPKLLELADVFHVPMLKRVKYIYLPTLRPPFISACQIAVGMCWKAGIAAEVIGLPERSIGEQLYTAKIFLNTGEMLAWTLAIVLISLLGEQLVRLWGRGKER